MSQTVDSAFDAASFSGAGVVPAPGNVPQGTQAQPEPQGQANQPEPQGQVQGQQQAQGQPENVPRGTQGQPESQQVQGQQPQQQGQAQPGNVPHGTQAQPEGADAPITDWSKAEIDLAGYEPNAEALASFGELAVNLGLTPAQAQGLARWQMDYMKAQREAVASASVRELNQEWGARAGANVAAVNKLIDKVDGILGNGSFRQAIEQSGADCSANFVRGLLAISGMFAEDSLGGQGGQPIQARPESTLDGITEAFRRARGK